MFKRAGRPHARIPLSAGVFSSILFLSSCSSPVDLKQALQVTDVSTGWYDAGVVEGKNKLVPSVTFKLRKPDNVTLSTVSLNVVFRFADTGDERDDVFVQRVEFAGNETQPITARAPTGYTAEQPQSRADMLKHSQFRDTDVEIFARQSSAQWILLHKVRVARELMTR
jgi:hypothetical protein